MKVLIVDDDRSARFILSSTSLHAGFEVVEGSNGAEGLEVLQKERPNIIISDWQMPEMNGLEFCKRIRELPLAQYLYFILVTAGSEDSLSSRHAVEDGVDDILRKPLNPELVWMRLHVAQRIVKFSEEVRELKSLVPVCSYCKKVRNDQQYWESIEKYLKLNVGAEITHSVCPECYQKLLHANSSRS